MILSCVKRIRDKLGYSVGINLLGNVLRGSKNKQVRELELDTLSTYGLLKDRGRSEIHGMIDHLEAEGYLLTDSEFRTLELTGTAGRILYQGTQVQMLVEREKEEPQTTAEIRNLTGDQSELYDILRDLRATLAKEAGIPAYVVFSNATLTAMAKMRPESLEEFMAVPGVGETKAKRYGKKFLRAIQTFVED